MEPYITSAKQLERWKKKVMEKSGTFLAIFVLNLCILILLGGTVIYHLVVSQASEPIATFKIKTIPPPPKPPAHGGEAAKSLADPSVTVVPPQMTLPSIVTSLNSISFNVKSSSIPTLNSLSPNLQLPTGSGLERGTTGGGPTQTNPFGFSADGGSTGLVGYFYDLKQTS